MSDSLRGLAHDLRGPVLTIDGFAAEIALAATELARAAGQETGQDIGQDAGRGAAANGTIDPEALRKRVLDVVENDLQPCLACIASAAATLGERIDALDGAGGVAPEGGTHGR